MRNAKQQKLLLAPLLTTILFLSGCGSGDKPPVDTFHCPSVSNSATFRSYGQFAFGSAGDDSIARRITSDCGWHIFAGHNGGLGETLEVASPNEEVVFAWANSGFSAFRVTNGWIGQTDRGAKLGDSSTVFQGLYPEFTIVNPQLSMFKNGSLSVEAHFDQHGLLQELLMGNLFRG